MKHFKPLFFVVFTLALLIKLMGGYRQVYDDTKKDEPDVMYRHQSSIEHHRYWNDYDNHGYALSYEVPDDLNKSANNIRNGLPEPRFFKWNYLSFWNNLYGKLYESNRAHLEFIQDTLRQIQSSSQLSRVKFAELIVSFIQDIPYSYVLHGSNCEDYRDQPCSDNVRFGLYSPVEFLYNTIGDCDTRSLLLFTLFKNFGYEPAIFISNAYEHAVLGINLPLHGLFLKYRGKKYYFWETTATGWLAGMISPKLNNLENWEVVIN